MPSTFAKLGAFKRQSLEDLSESYDFSEALDGDDLETFFGEPPERAHLLKRDVTVTGPIQLGDEGPGIWILDGNLTVDGTLTFSAADDHNLLLITGDLTCTNLSVQDEADLLVLGSLRVSGVFLSSNSDGGNTIVHGNENEVSAIVLCNHGEPRFLDESFEPVRIDGWRDTPRTGTESRVEGLRAPFNREGNHELLEQALLSGTPVLAPL